ncbi:MAG: hypothetical protein V9E99_11335 [Microthrixaceae bacterium]
MVFEGSGVLLGKRLARDLAPYDPNREYLQFGLWNTMVNTSAVPPVAGLSNSSQTAYVNNYDPRPGPDQSDRQWWVVDVGFKDYLDESLALSDALPYGYDYIPGSAAIADYTWGGTSGTYSFTPLPDGGATTIDNSTVGSACTPADPSTPAWVNSGGQTLRWNFSRAWPHR